LALKFDGRGLLPEGIHRCDEQEFSALLVDAFPGDPTRSDIRDGFFEFRRQVASRGLAARQWVDGSYVTTKRARADVDVVNFMLKSLLNSLPADVRLFVKETMAKPDGPNAYLTHSFVAAYCDASDPQYVRYEQVRQYWRNWFGHTRPLPLPTGGQHAGLPKGILSMGVGPEAEQPDVEER